MAVRLTCGRTALPPVAVRVAGLALNRNIPHEAPIAVSLHVHALHRLSIARLDVSAEFLMQKDQLSSSWRLASANSSSRACRWASALRWRGACSDSELLDAGATQTLSPLWGRDVAQFAPSE
jgi:hypothetical protein